MEIWTKFVDSGIPWDCIYLDFAKAFDSVPHERLLSKVKACGINGKVWGWIRDFLHDRKQRVVLGQERSQWRPVTSGIPQGSVLGPLLFIIFINDLPKEIESYTKIFADDTKLFKAIEDATDSNIIQCDLQKLLDWSKKWQLPFNTAKCKVLHYGKDNPHFNYIMENNILKKALEEKDLGVTFDDNLNFKIHIRNITAKANSRVGLIKRSFLHLSIDSFIPLFKALIRPLLEYCSNIWFPVTQLEINEIEKVQRRATKLIPSLKNTPYPDRLKYLNLHTLKFRRERNDMIQTFRILKNIDELDIATFFELDTVNRTRGHSLKLKKPRVESRTRQNSFSQRIINPWNSLPESAVSCTTLNSFKTELLRAWKNHPYKFDPLGNI